ncbi:hypothetical protein [Streptomyces roseolus]|uniref:hypothetical protein n=1 Tax=Streptomyces roseolus TaxID=67358 RepID=UPI00167AF715|nr:hypothetical protein [Streptomyces roseolus]GGR51870.1 hypothetical protein GCM10010282_51010 [Streptomyces roseolus]
MRNPRAANAALDAYGKLVSGERTEPIETQAADLITDLLHLVANSEGEETAVQAAERAIFHFQYEHETT